MLKIRAGRERELIRSYRTELHMAMSLIEEATDKLAYEIITTESTNKPYLNKILDSNKQAYKRLQALYSYMSDDLLSEEDDDEKDIEFNDDPRSSTWLSYPSTSSTYGIGPEDGRKEKPKLECSCAEDSSEWLGRDF
jgi:hypothetical protein